MNTNPITMLCSYNRWYIDAMVQVPSNHNGIHKPVPESYNFTIHGVVHGITFWQTNIAMENHNLIK